MKYLFYSVIIILGMIFICPVDSIAHSSHKGEQISRARVFTDQAGLQIISQLGICVDHGFKYPGLFIENEFIQSDLDLLRAHGYTVEILLEDVIAERDKINALFDLEKIVQPLYCGQNVDTIVDPQNFNLGSFSGYFTYEEMNLHLDLMSTIYSNLISERLPASSTGITTWEGREVEYVLMSDGINAGGNEPQILFNALHHAREPLSMQQLIYTMWYMLENYSNNDRIKYLIDNAQIYFIPCVNPDGYVHDQTIAPNGGGFWRKNKRDNNANGVFEESEDGVDLNRNYGYEWGYDNTGSSPDPSSVVYRGIAGFSEPETETIREFVIDRNILFVYNYHTYGNLLIAPYGYDESVQLEDSVQYYEYAQYVTEYNGYTYGEGTSTVGYTVNGSADDYMYGDDVEKNRIFSFTPEVGQVGTGFYPPMSDIYSLCRMNVSQNLRAIEVILSSGKVTDESPRFIAEADGYLPFEFTRLGMQDEPITVEYLPISSNIASLSPSQTFTGLLPGESISDSVAYALLPNALAGDEIEILVSVYNGHYYKQDTIKKIYGPIEVVFEESGTFDNSDWPTMDNWGSTTSDFYSPPASITDSPFSYMTGGEESAETMVIDLTGATHATLRFMAKWHIASRFDYIQVLARKESEVNFTPLCGKFTKIGSDYQADESQVYDGIMFNWVQEEMILDDFVGENVIIQFVAQSYANNAFDGFLFDDLEVWAIEGVDLFLPIAVDDQGTSIENEAIIIDILANDNLSGNLDTTVSIISAPNHGTGLIDNDYKLNYIPNSVNISPTDSIVYEVCNSSVVCDQATVYIEISIETGLENQIIENPMFQVFPNPNNGNCTIRYTGENEFSQTIFLSISSIDGKRIIEKQISRSEASSGLNFDLKTHTNIQSGLYFFEFRLGESEFGIEKVLIH